MQILVSISDYVNACTVGAKEAHTDKVLKSVGRMGCRDGGSSGSRLPLAASVGSGREGVGQGGVIITECGWIPTPAVVLTDKPTADCECSQERRPSETGSGGGRARRRERVAGGRAHGRCARSARSLIWFPPSGTVFRHREKEESVGSSLCQGSVTQCLAGSQGSWVRTYIYWSQGSRVHA